jgi:hypothetical protein
MMPMSPSAFQNTLNKYLDFHRAYLFRVMFFDGILETAKSFLVTELIANTDTPTSSTTQIGVGWMGSKLKLAGKTDYLDWKVSVRDDTRNVASTYFHEWRSKVYSVENGRSYREQGSSSKVGYKRSAIVAMLGNRPLDLTIARAYILQGVWPKDVGAVTLDYSTEAISVFPVNFSIDYFDNYSLTSQVSQLLTTATTFVSNISVGF